MSTNRCDVCFLKMAAELGAGDGVTASDVAKLPIATLVATAEDGSQWFECSDHPDPTLSHTGSPRKTLASLEGWEKAARAAMARIEGRAPDAAAETEPAPRAELEARELMRAELAPGCDVRLSMQNAGDEPAIVIVLATGRVSFGIVG